MLYFLELTDIFEVYSKFNFKFMFLILKQQDNASLWIKYNEVLLDRDLR